MLFSYYRMCSLTTECVLLLQNVFSYYRMCSLTMLFSCDKELCSLAKWNQMNEWMKIRLACFFAFFLEYIFFSFFVENIFFFCVENILYLEKNSYLFASWQLTLAFSFRSLWKICSTGKKFLLVCVMAVNIGAFLQNRGHLEGFFFGFFLLKNSRIQKKK